MAKIAEVGFTQSGTNQDETIGNIDVTMSGSSFIPTLGDFNVRPGWLINSTTQLLPTGGSGVFRFSDATRLTKSIVIWARFTGTLAGANGGMYVENQALATHHGWFYNNTGTSLIFCVNAAVQTTGTTVLPSGFTSDTSNFRMLTATIDRNLTQTKLYADDQFIATVSAVPTGNRVIRLSSDVSGNRIAFQVGLIQVYDHILSLEEIEDLYDTGLIDTLSQQPIGTLSGVVFDQDSVPISGALVTTFNHSSEQIESFYTTTSGGDYVAYFPTVGTYSLYTTKPGVPGGRAFPVIVTSGGIDVDSE